MPDRTMQVEAALDDTWLVVGDASIRAALEGRDVARAAAIVEYAQCSMTPEQYARFRTQSDVRQLFTLAQGNYAGAQLPTTRTYEPARADAMSADEQHRAQIARAASEHRISQATYVTAQSGTDDARARLARWLAAHAGSMTFAQALAQMELQTHSASHAPMTPDVGHTRRVNPAIRHDIAGTSDAMAAHTERLLTQRSALDAQNDVDLGAPDTFVISRRTIRSLSNAHCRAAFGVLVDAISQNDREWFVRALVPLLPTVTRNQPLPLSVADMNVSQLRETFNLASARMADTDRDHMLRSLARYGIGARTATTVPLASSPLMDATTHATARARRSLGEVARSADLATWDGVCALLLALREQFPYEPSNEADEWYVLISDLEARARALAPLRTLVEAGAAADIEMHASNEEGSERPSVPRIDDTIHEPVWDSGARTVITRYNPPLPAQRAGFTLCFADMSRDRRRSWFEANDLRTVETETQTDRVSELRRITEQAIARTHARRQARSGRLRTPQVDLSGHPVDVHSNTRNEPPAHPNARSVITRDDAFRITDANGRVPTITRAQDRARWQALTPSERAFVQIFVRQRIVDGIPLRAVETSEGFISVTSRRSPISHRREWFVARDRIVI